MWGTSQRSSATRWEQPSSRNTRHVVSCIIMKSLITLSPSFQLDVCLQQDSAVYRSFRVKGSIGPMRVQLVAAGAFNELRKQMMDFSNTSPNTFKMHRVLRRKEYADFLLGKTVSWSRDWTMELVNCAFSNRDKKAHFWLLKMFISTIFMILLKQTVKLLLLFCLMKCFRTSPGLPWQSQLNHMLSISSVKDHFGVYLTRF